MPDEIIITKLEKEPKEEIAITHVDIDEGLPGTFKEVNRREVEDNYHDLLILAGPKGQAGSVRKLTRAYIVENGEIGQPFNEVVGAFELVRKDLQESDDSMEIVGVGTAVGIRQDAEMFTSVYSLPLYFSGTTELMSNRWQGSADFSQFRLFTRNDQKQIIPIQNISVTTPFSFL